MTNDGNNGLSNRYEFYYRPHGQQLLFKMLSMETVKFYRLGDVEAKRFATPKARSGALDLPPGTYAVTIGKDHLLLRILFHNPIGVNLAPLASYSKELAAGFVDTGKASTSISIQDLANAQTMAVASTASSQGYRITRLAKIGENSNTLVLKVKHSRQQGETALKRPNPSSYDQMTSTDWVRASQAWLNEFSIHRQLLSTPNASKVCRSHISSQVATDLE